MEAVDYRSIRLVSALICIGAVLSISWMVIPFDIRHIFFFCETSSVILDNPSSFVFSINPDKPLTVRLITVYPIFCESLNGIILLISARICPRLRMKYFGELWNYTILFEVLKYLDLILSYRMLEFRVIIVSVIIFIHIISNCTLNKGK